MNKALTKADIVESIYAQTEKNRAEVKNIVENGNTAGFHSVSHDIHKLYVSKTSSLKFHNHTQ